MPANLENSAVATGLEKVSFHSNSKERQCQRMLKLPHNCTHFQKNARLAQRVIRKAIQYFPEQRSCSCVTSLKDALVTERSRIPKKTRKDLDLLIGKYL